MNLSRNQSIALFVGAGAVENAWVPILKAIQPVYFKEEISIDGATSGLARLVYNLRWFSANSGDALNKCKQILKDTKASICEQIKIAQRNNKLFVRDDFWKIIGKITDSNCNRLMVVSTNWDTVVEDAVNTIPIIRRMFGNQNLFAAHIHGVYSDPNNIYLPSEIIEEPYRTSEEKMFLGNMHASVMQAMAFADIIIIYGLSISPLDAELTQVLGACLDHPNVKAVKVIDPDHKLVAERINLLIRHPIKKIAVEGYSPGDLNNCHNYSLQ